MSEKSWFLFFTPIAALLLGAAIGVSFARNDMADAALYALAALVCIYTVNRVSEL